MRWAARRTWIAQWEQRTAFGCWSLNKKAERLELLSAVLAVHERLVLTMMPFEHEDDAIAVATYGLTNYVQTADTDRARRVARRSELGSSCQFTFDDQRIGKPRCVVQGRCHLRSPAWTFCCRSTGLPEGAMATNSKGAHVHKAREATRLGLLMLGAALPQLIDQRRRREWTRLLTPTLAGRRYTVVGLGAIGVMAAEEAQALGMRVNGVSRRGEPHAAATRTLPIHGP